MDGSVDDRPGGGWERFARELRRPAARLIWLAVVIRVAARLVRVTDGGSEEHQEGGPSGKMTHAAETAGVDAADAWLVDVILLLALQAMHAYVGWAEVRAARPVSSRA